VISQATRVIRNLLLCDARFFVCCCLLLYCCLFILYVYHHFAANEVVQKIKLVGTRCRVNIRPEKWSSVSKISDRVRPVCNDDNLRRRRIRAEAAARSAPSGLRAQRAADRCLDREAARTIRYDTTRWQWLCGSVPSVDDVPYDYTTHDWLMAVRAMRPAFYSAG